MKETQKTVKRILIGAVRSGSGKTLFTCALLALFKTIFQTVRAHKCGPDYIDPMFHRAVLGVEGTNLDPFFSDGEELNAILAENDADMTVIEGAMGIYDGITGLGKTGSCYDVAGKTGTPVILLVDAEGYGATIMSVIKGILEDDDKHLIRGIIFNRMSEMYLNTLKPELDQILTLRAQPPVILGAIPRAKDICFESRHLGLVMPDEIDNIQEQLRSFAQLIKEHVDVEELIRIAQGAEPIYAAADVDRKDPTGADAERPVLAVARDEAFCFYYERNIRLLEEAGCRVVYFSPLHDQTLPEGTKGILLGGGYPELFAKELSENEQMKTAIRDAIEQGIPSLAECGGFMYLGTYIENADGTRYPMTGVLEEGFANKGRLTRFGYVTVSPQTAGLLDSPIRGHEFHYYDCDNSGADCLAQKPSGNRSWPCMYMGPDHLWGFPHLYYPSQPELVRRFVKAMKK